MPRVLTPKPSADQVRTREFTDLTGVSTILGFPKSALARIRLTDDRFPKAVAIPGRSHPAFRVRDILAWAAALK